MGEGSSDEDTNRHVPHRFFGDLHAHICLPEGRSKLPLRVHCNHSDPFLDSPSNSVCFDKRSGNLLRPLTGLNDHVHDKRVTSENARVQQPYFASENNRTPRRPTCNERDDPFVTTKPHRRERFADHFSKDIYQDPELSTPALTPDASPTRVSCLSSPILLTCTGGHLDGEAQEEETGLAGDSHSRLLLDTTAETPPLPTFYSVLNKRLRPTQRPNSALHVAMSPTRSPDRFVSGRFDADFSRQQLKLSKAPGKLSPSEKTLRRRTGRSDPFLQQGQPRARAPRVSLMEGPIEPSQVDRLRAEPTMGRRREVLINGYRRVSPSSVWNTGGSGAALGTQPDSFAEANMLSAGRPHAPTYISRFVNDVKSDHGRTLHEKRLALALGIDPLGKILTGGPDIINRFSDPALLAYKAGFQNAEAIKAYHDAGYGAMEWVNNQWIKRVLEAPNLRDDFYCSVLAYSRTADRLAVGLGDKLYLWSEETGVVNPPREAEPRFSRLTYITSLAFSSVQGGRAILAIARANGCISLYSPIESEPHFMDLHLHSAAAHICFSPRTVRRPSARLAAVITEQEVFLVGDDAGIVHVYLVEWPSQQHRDLFGWPGAVTLHSKISVHTQQVCGIAWSPDGTYFATGGNDNLCALFDARKILEPPPGVAVFRTESAGQHWRLAAAVKAIAFCPWQRGLLAAGGGSNDRGIHFYHTLSGAALAIIDCAAQVTSLIWSTTRREIVATFGFAQPEHPYRVVVYAWPSCQQVVAIPWQEEMRALFAIAYPGGPNGARGGRGTASRAPPSAQSQQQQRAITGTGAAAIDQVVNLATARAMRPGRGRVSGRAGAVAEGASSARRTQEEGCIVVAGSDGSIKFHEVWADDGVSGVGGTVGLGGSVGALSALGRHGLLGGSDILEALHGIEREEAEVIR